MPLFSETKRRVYYPHDRRFRIGIRPSVLLLIAVLMLVPFMLAWLQGLFWGLPNITPVSAAVSGTPSGPHGFPM